MSSANAGLKVLKTTGLVSGHAQTTSIDMSFTDAQGGTVDEAGGGFSLVANAAAFITCGDSAAGTAYSALTINPTSLRIDGQATSQAMSFGTALAAASSANSDLNITFVVTSPTAWQLPVGWLGVDGGSVHYVLRRGGTSITLFDSRTGVWQTAKGVLAAGEYELEIACSSSAAISVTGEPEQFQSSFVSAYYDIMLELKDSPTAPGRVDINLDGFTDYTDFDAFVSAFEVGASLSDFNDDGFTDFTDFDAFVAAFDNGQ
jgi:hypothetical protein